MTSEDKHLEFEEQHLRHDRKESKRQRKIASATDRSKFKKTDQDQRKKSMKKLATASETQRQGRVLSISGKGIIVAQEEQLYLCTLRGALKQEEHQLKNLITVGDFVLFEPKNHSEGFILEVLERTSILSRADNLSRRREQLIAANIDQVLITTSVVSPAFKAGLVDRYIIAAQKGGMRPVIIINKIDQLEKADEITIAAEKELVQQFIAIYTELGYQVIPVSCVTEQGIAQLKEVMRGKASVFSGQSGVGKSSLINLVTGLELPTGEIVSKTQKGAHTTTSAQLIPLKEGGWCIDTPGIKSFGLWNLQAEEIQQFYHEIQAEGLRCRYPNCTHTHEPDCAVLLAMEAGAISALRYESYCSLLASVETPHRLR